MATAAVSAMETEDWVPAIGFGDRLRVVRRKKHRTQDEMAALLGVKKVTYGSWESGAATPAYEDVLTIARRLYMLDRVPIWWTLGVDQHPEARSAVGDGAGSVLRAGARSSTDRASDYGSFFGEFPRHRRERRRQMGVVPLRLVRAS